MSKGFNSTQQIINKKMMNINEMITNKYQNIKSFFTKNIPIYLKFHHYQHDDRSRSSSSSRRSSRRSRTGYNDENNYIKIKHQDSYISKWSVWKIFNKKYHHHHHHHQGFSNYGTIPWIDDINDNHNNQQHHHHHKMKKQIYNHNYYKKKFSHHFYKIIYLFTDYYNDVCDHTHDVMKNMISKVINWLKGDRLI
jgi:hypothetical protein